MQRSPRPMTGSALIVFTIGSVGLAAASVVGVLLWAAKRLLFDLPVHVAR